MKKNDYIYGMHKETYKLFFDNELEHEIEDYQKNDMENMIALDTIDFYSRYQEKKIFKALIKKYYKIKNIDFDKITYNPYSEEYEYNDRDNNIFVNFSMLSDFVDDKDAKELLSAKRYHVCHKKSIMYSQNIKDSKVLTGFVYLNLFRYLHSIIEYNENGVPYIIDWTKNLIMSKDDYIRLTKFEVVSTLDSNQIKKDLIKFQNVFGNNKKGCNGLYKLYATFGAEIIDDFNKKQLK